MSASSTQDDTDSRCRGVVRAETAFQEDPPSVSFFFSLSVPRTKRANTGDKTTTEEEVREAKAETQQQEPGEKILFPPESELKPESFE